MVFKLFIHTDNAAFEGDPSPEIARILRQTAGRIESGAYYGHYLTIRDHNGNDVGRFALKNEDGSCPNFEHFWRSQERKT